MALTPNEELELLELEEADYQASKNKTLPGISKTESVKLGGIQGTPFIGTYADEAEGLFNSIKSGKPYKEERDIVRKQYRDAEEANPGSYNSAMMAPSVLMAPLKAIPVVGWAESAIQGAVEGLGASESDNALGMARDTALSGALSAATAGLGKGAKYLSNTSAAKKVSEKIGGGLRNVAEKFAKIGTGATGVQLNKLDDKAGATLLDEGITGWFSAPKDIALKARLLKEKSGEEMSRSLNFLDEQGASGTRREIVDYLEKQIDKTRGLTSNDPQNAKIQNIIDSFKARDLDEAIPLSSLELEKRGFGKKISNWETLKDSDTAYANKQAYNATRELVEDKALATAPDLAEKFKRDKALFGITSPIEEVSQRRANQLQQMPIGGLLDTAAIGLGTTGYGEEGLGTGVAFAALRRGVAPRVPNFTAKSFDALSKIVQKSPQVLGKYGPTLINASSRGQHGLGMANFLLQKNDPEYREKIKELEQQQEE